LLAGGRVTEAEKEFRRALELDGGDARTMVAIAACLRESDRAAESIAMLETAVRADPDYIYAQLDLALTFMKARRWSESIEAARLAIRLDPDNPLGYSMAGTGLQAIGRYKEAADALERAIDLDPLDRIGAPRLLLARVYGALGRNQEAIDVLVGDVPEEPEELYRLAWQFVRNNYLDRTFNGQDWDAWRDRFEGRLKSEPQALGAIALMLASLDDRNTRLRSHDQTARILFTPRTTGTEFTSTGKALSTSKTIDTRHLEGNVGYIAITNLSDPKLPEQIEDAVKEMKTTEGVIIDLRGNQGGADREVARITGMFVKPGTETGTIITQEGTKKVTAEPAEDKTRNESEPIIAEEKPVVVLVDRNTASSAENLAASLKESKRAVLVGEKTHGKAAVQVPKLLPGGAMVLVVGAEHADLSGNIYTGVGIDPDLHIKDAATGDRRSRDQSIEKARELIAKPKRDSQE
jgi:C-terminal peptidase prc